ncbi:MULTISPECIES: FCD domain-containing protein [unclassified Halomonas]|uniref:FadR/GntR family transcriptional regulator n=1 Tax=unclassified Halomonas TaxID=2609666 RepID=UPI002468C769|nr:MULTISPECIES: FCD domain-containing protein [unclassified Halomonas]
MLDDLVLPADGGAPALAAVLARAILSGQLPAGSDFPREKDLCDRFAVSRNRVRNALASLAATGLVERTAGRGSRVREITGWHLLDPLMSDWLTGLARPDPRLVREIYAFRLSAEPQVAELAALAADGRDLARLEAAFAGMRDTAGTGMHQQHAEHDVAFHDAVYQASHNLVWRQMGHLLRPSIIALIQHSQHQAASLEDSLERHRRVMEAIRLRQPQAARRAARAVLERTATDLGLIPTPTSHTEGHPA